MNQKATQSRPLDVMWIAAITLGAITGNLFGTWTWIQEPIRHMGFTFTLVVSISLVVVGIVIMGGAINYRREGYRFGMYIMLYCGVAIVSVAGSILLDAPAPFGI